MLCALALTSRNARAQDQEPTLLVYRAPADCPPVGDFQRSVERRSSRIHFVDEGSHARELWIFLRKDGDLTVGELRLIEENGNLRQRSVHFPNCADAVEGLALIATVSLDPQALLEGPKSVPQTAPEPPPAPPETPAPPPPTSAPKPKPAARAPVPQVRRRGVEVALGAEGNAFLHAFPEAAFGGSAFVEVGSASQHLFAPQFRGAITYAQRNSVTGARIEDGAADVKLGLISVYGCPLRISENPLIFQPCAFVSGGELYTKGRGDVEASASFHPQFSWGGAALLGLRVAEDFEIVADASVGVSSIRDRFGYTDATGAGLSVAWTTPLVYISTGLGFRVRLP